MGDKDQIWDKYPRKFGKYHLLGPLAQGGMGALYLAVAGDRGLERLMVIKTVLPHLADAEYVARFRDEAKVVVKLSHGNLIPVFDAGQVDGELFLAMDFVEGRDLRAVWNRCAKKQVAFPVDVAVYIVKELCRGLYYAHTFPDLELVHRDISPPNVLISYNGEVKLTDFGLASSTLKLEKTAPGIIYGKVAYMSPEQARGEKLDGRSDQYAAGIVLWELLTGRQLFPPGKDQPQDLLNRARNPDVLRPSKRAPRVPPELDEVCLRALQPERGQRYAGCEEMRQGLQTWLAGNAPTTDQTRISAFLQDLFSEDIVRDRAERNSMIANVRRRAETLPPTDELRQMIERSSEYEIGEYDDEPPVRSHGSIGRRAADRGDGTSDRRQHADRRGGRAVTAAGPFGLAQTSGAGASAALEVVTADEDLDEQLMAGMIIDGRYRIVELIGEGGMGKVFLAEHVEIGKRVALKVLHQSYSRMPDLVERFRREARAASKIGHPHIVDVTDSGTTAEGSAYFVMEYLEGVELGSVIEREGALDVARGLRIATQICRALSAAHAAGIIHRDLKPENIFLTVRDGTADFVKVLDFGIAKTTEAEQARERRLTSPGMAMGTPEYMAPEQAAGRPADERCDVYALGAILYEMLTGVPPYQGDNFMEILTKKATIDPVAAQHLRSTIPETVSVLVGQAMGRNPDDRPRTMDAFEYELTKCLAGRGAAVAQILGMSADPALVAQLNPGLSVRSVDDEGAVAPGGKSPSPGRGVPLASGSNPPGVGAMDHAAAAALAGRAGAPATTGMASAASLTTSGSFASLRASRGDVVPGWDDLAADSAAADHELTDRRSGASVLGWLFLAALIFGGVGVVLYVALGERGEAATGAAGSAGARPGDTTDEGAGPGTAVDTGTKPNEDAPVPPKEVGTKKDDRRDDRKDRDDRKAKDDRKDKAQARPDPAPPPAAPSDVPTTAEGARALLGEADRLLKAHDWDSALDAYSRLARSSYLKRDAYLGQAYASWQLNRVDKTIEFAQKAVKAGAGVDARKMLGHAFFKKGNYRQALAYYKEILEVNPKDKEVLEAVVEAEKRLGGKP
jgi:eukaryotic-like serine/threonine-protein kinase